MNNFAPLGASTVSLTATTSSSRVALSHSGRPYDVRLYNAGSVVVFVEFGDSTVAAATATGMPIAPGTVEAFSLPPSATHMAGITSSSTAAIYVTLGYGL
jgi:hypothetical protein